jgi:putative membrane protein
LIITNYGLATLNAVLNGTALLCVLYGARAIYAKPRQAHVRAMLSAFVISIVFLASYFTRIFLFGDQHFPGTGAIRYIYFFLLISHVVLALLIAPAVLYTVILGLRDNFAKHRKIAPKVLPVWIYVLATGVLVYVFLYHLV